MIRNITYLVTYYSITQISLILKNFDENAVTFASLYIQTMLQLAKEEIHNILKRDQSIEMRVYGLLFTQLFLNDDNDIPEKVKQ